MPIVEHAAATPDKVATVMGSTGATLTYGELDERSLRFARVLRAAGVGIGDVVAVFLENNIRYHELYWGAVRTGAYLCAVNKYLTAEEAAYIVDDSGAKVLVTSAAMSEAPRVAEMVAGCPTRLAVDGAVAGFERYEDAIAAEDPVPFDREPLGDFMNYSSGTTGRPKGIRRPLSGNDFTSPSALDSLCQRLYGIGTDTVYLSPAPLYHSAPLAFTAAVHSLGGTNVIMERFDPVAALALIERHRVTHSQWVPTMFVRMLKLDDEQRAAYDLSSHRVAVHAAAPCAIEVKRRMIDWWGPILHEYYGGTELNGMTYCTSEQWLAHPGTVGSPILGTLHVCDETGAELPVGQPGVIYFERDTPAFEYHGDPEKTRSAQHPEHPLWTKLGDIGYLDEDGYLYLTDRESFMIISGGVNIYPQEIEDVFVLHPKVADVAVIGVPDAEMGEAVKAVIQPADGIEPGDELAAELLGFARERLASYKVPRSVDFEEQLPRLETGKLYKRLLRDRYWGDATSRIV